MGENKNKLEMKSLDRKTLSKQVIDQIIDLLLSGQLKPGDKLPPEMELLEILGVSRPVLREALSSLETLGIIQRRTREGTFFTNSIGSKPYSIMLALSAGNLPAIMETRMSLELGLVSIAAEKITDEDLARLKETIDYMANNVEYTEQDRDFHRIIAYSASNPVMAGIIDPLLDAFDSTVDQISKRDRNQEETLAQHIEIYKALEKRDPIESFQKMYQHLDYVRNKVLKGIKVNS
ncbi:FadR/GntR family transcriptional regulator [Desertibacillus haloalkaliphilus]|uniref:FadR/GntR family transcriptional regulator n=1 Tax=Desertibacillus haloalkaliphilus TaxID=1328930 RepID=UPI001C26C086|nr:FadR/GntR family transcriptional regulator [Desertibacillus haloalkaliphilus]MBU8906467.1 FadR family transcriptional regulator [Desertibacillus haloalkaliphilus]